MTGTFQQFCRNCGCTFVASRCECKTIDDVIDMDECPYCGVHKVRGAACQCPGAVNHLLFSRFRSLQTTRNTP